MSSPLYLLRFDDICPTMNWRIWAHVEQILVERGIRPLLAVVPDNRDECLRVEPVHPDFWAMVRRWRDWGWTIGMHGYQHTYISRDAGILGLKPASEFAGVPAAEQHRRLAAGLHIFRENGIEPPVWVAPGHSFDWNTVAALRDLGITRISDGLFFAPRRDRIGATWIPQQLWRFRRMPRGTWTVCLHHNSWGSGELAQFEESVKRYAGALRGFDGIIGRSAAPFRPLSFLDRSLQTCAARFIRTRAHRPASTHKL